MEQVGKGYSSIQGGKSSLKTTASFKGKDDMTKRGRKVQFDYEDSLDAHINLSLKSGGKGGIPNGKGNWSKGGKGDKANGVKSPVTKQAAPLQLNIEQELPEDAKCLMDCEAAQILQGIQEQMIILSEDPNIKIPISFDRGLQYAKSGSEYTSPPSVRRVLEYPFIIISVTLKKHGASDGEICTIANTCPESVDEVFALIPSFKGKHRTLREPLKDALSELAKLKHSIKP
ncbi:hypothetical protein RJ639_017229 [Escallonia herrerae]|uniref:RNA polymerase Rpb4/RPC9 core domain-containing protein n=1 Tax=Escallonia herrerae TaxID=1293975 RepID=A0AA88VH09_9ASTE|nr:hypothetical protein RJ639_017229 [Escallonia herrerae]